MADVSNPPLAATTIDGVDGAPPIRVLVADAHPLLRLGIRTELEEAGYDVCAEAASCAEAILCALRYEPDICLLDLDLPGGGLKAAGAIAKRLPQTKILLLSETSSRLDLASTLRSGAVGCVEKDMDPRRLPQVLAAVLAGEPVVPRRHLGQLLASVGLTA